MLWGLIDDGSSAWTLREFLAALVPIGVTSRGERTWRSLGDLPFEFVDQLLGLQKVFERLRDDLEEPVPVDVDDELGDVTVAARVRKALSALRMARGANS